jgi:hypothetical protein
VPPVLDCELGGMLYWEGWKSWGAPGYCCCEAHAAEEIDWMVVVETDGRVEDSTMHKSWTLSLIQCGIDSGTASRPGHT